MKNVVYLLGHYGGDETHALSAWTSTRRELDAERRERIGSMLKRLADDGHHTPFEKSYLHFLVTCDTASHIHLLKHRIGVSVNAESARYRELKDDKFHIPDDWPRWAKDWTRARVRDAYTNYHALLKELVDHGMPRKRAKESARFLLPYANQLTLDVGFNFRSFMHFQRLRNDEHAQLEIRTIAQEMLAAVSEINGNPFELSLEAFGYTS